MTQEHAADATERLRRLSELHADLRVARAELHRHCVALQRAGELADHDHPASIPHTWPSPDEYRAAHARVTGLKGEIGALINELANLGVSPTMLTVPD